LFGASPLPVTALSLKILLKNLQSGSLFIFFFGLLLHLIQKKGGNMKQKKFNKKLILNKKTIANLNNGEMKDVNGGKDDISNSLCITCFTCDTDCGATCFGVTCPTRTGTPQSNPCCKTC
jgi:hypothetical protein